MNENNMAVMCFEDFGLPAQEEALAEASSSGNFSGLGFLRLSRVGVFSDITGDLGSRLTVVVGPWRARAILWVGGKITEESFQESSESYQKIKAAGKTPGTSDGPSCGPEFLLWVPTRRRFLTLHMKNTAAAEAPKAVALRGKAAVLFSRERKNKAGTWYVPAFEPSGEKVSPDSLPDEEAFCSAMELFCAPLQTPTEAPTDMTPF